MKHGVDLSKEVQGIKTNLTRRFKFIFLLWSLLFPFVHCLFSQCAFLQFHANLCPGFLNKKCVGDQPVLMAELDGNILLIFHLPAVGLPFGLNIQMLPEKYQMGCIGVQDCK